MVETTSIDIERQTKYIRAITKLGSSADRDSHKKSLSEMNNERVFTCGHEVPEDTIKLFIQLIIITNVDKKMGKKLLPLLEYLHWTEDSQRHNLLH